VKDIDFAPGNNRRIDHCRKRSGAVAGGLIGALISINIPKPLRGNRRSRTSGENIDYRETDGDTGRIQALLALHGADTGVRS
jgi:hypothetical protein